MGGKSTEFSSLRLESNKLRQSVNIYKKRKSNIRLEYYILKRANYLGITINPTHTDGARFSPSTNTSTSGQVEE